MPYTFVPKPSGTSYTNQNTVGKQQYDQSDIFYDDSGVFYDGVNYNAYTNIPKPQFQVTTLNAGFANGLLIPLTRASVIGQMSISPYTNIPKPTTP
jgi:hypothetical protein